ncbi:MAG: YhcN/YlaJ family sporulation lipoprotein [Bacillus sp. (in: firmicutes)]
MKKIKQTSFLLGLSICLTGCGIQDEEANNKKLNAAQPLGYYSNEHHEDNNNGVNARILDGEDNDGPVTEIMDHTFGEEGEQRDSIVRNINNNRTRNQDNWQNNQVEKENSYDAALANKIDAAAGKVANVQEVQSVVYGNRVLVAIQVKNSENIETTKNKTQREINSYTDNKDVSIVTDKGIFSGIEDINKKIRDGQPERTISESIENMFKTVDREVSR